jgi:hypothetical protein
VLNTVYKDAIMNRDKMLSVLKGPKFEQILQKAREKGLPNMRQLFPE